MRVQLVQLVLGRHLLKVIVHYRILTLLHLKCFDVLIKQRLKNLNCISVHFEVHKAMVEDCVAVCDLAVELSI